MEQASLSFIVRVGSIIILKDQLQSKMNWNLAVNEPFKNLKEYASLHGQSLTLNPEQKGEKEEAGETKEGENAHDERAVFQGWGRKCEQKWEISFQKYFLAEHTATFKKLLWNFKEYGLPILVLENATSFLSSPTLFSQPESPLTLPYFLASDSSPIPNMHLTAFAICQPVLEDLERFFTFLLAECKPLLAGQLIALSLQIWIQFRGLEFKFLERKELLGKAREWADANCGSVYTRTIYPSLELTDPAPQNNAHRSPILPHLALFLRYFATTTLFILSGYFENPYSDLSFDFQSESQPSYPKRKLPFSPLNLSPSQSDDSSQDEEFFTGRKHQKQA